MPHASSLPARSGYPVRGSLALSERVLLSQRTMVMTTSSCVGMSCARVMCDARRRIAATSSTIAGAA